MVFPRLGRFAGAKYNTSLFILLAFMVVNLALEAWYVYTTRHYLRNYYPELYAGIKQAVSRPTGGAKNLDQPLARQRIETFTLLGQHITEAKPIIFAGDSLTDTFEWSEYFADVKHIAVLNRGVPGDTVGNLLERFEVTFLPRLQPKVFLMIGINDITLVNVCVDGNKGQFLGRYYSLLDRMVEAGIRAQEIFVQSILPVFRPDKSNEVIRSCNRLIRQYSRSKGINYIDLYCSLADSRGNLNARYSLDGLHLNADGYRIWLETIRPYISQNR